MDIKRIFLPAIIGFFFLQIGNAQCNNADPDSDGDGICNSIDQCPNFNDNLIGTPCDDGKVCTIDDKWISSCDCEGTRLPDSDNDGICDIEDQCPNFNDEVDIDDDGIPYCIDNCIDIDENDICDENEGAIIPNKLKLFFSHERGFYQNDFQLEIFTNDPNAVIKYTTNTSTPSVNAGTTYTGPISITGQTVIKVVAYNSNTTLPLVSHSYLFADEIIAGLNNTIKNDPVWGPQLEDALLDLPTISISGASNITTTQTETGISFEYIDNKLGEHFQLNAGAAAYGNHSVVALAKKNHRIFFRSDYGPTKLEYPLFKGYESGLEPVEKFDKLEIRSSHDSWLYSNSNIIPNYFSTKLLDDLMKEGGSINGHARHVHVYMNGDYRGMYTLRERFDDDMVSSYTGKDNSEYDFISGSKTTVNVFNTLGVLKDGTGDHWNNILSLSSDYDNWKQHVEEHSFFDLMIYYMVFYQEAEWNAVGDGEVGAGFYFNINDADLMFTRPTGNRVNLTNSNGPNNMFKNLYNSGNLNFFRDFSDRVHCHTTKGAFAQDYLTDLIDTLAGQIELGIIPESGKWGDASRTPTVWQNEIDRMKNVFLGTRLPEVFQYIKNFNLYPDTEGVEFSQEGGIIDGTLTLTNTNGAGEIYYTLDGTDVSLPDGSINPNAILYTAPITLSQGVHEIFARVYDASLANTFDRWSAFCCPKVFYVEQEYGDLIINEIHYNPSDSIFFNPDLNAMDTVKGKNFEFIEIKNIGSDPVNLFGARFSKGVDLTIDTPLIVPPNGFVVFAEDASWFEAKYGFAPDGVYSGELSNDGEKINIKDPFGYFIDTVRYSSSNPWDEEPNESNFSLELLHPTLENSNPINWFRSDHHGGTPKAENSRICAQSATPIIFNEINYNSNNDVLDAGDWVELYNPGQNIVDLSGWTFYDNGNKFILPAGTVIAPDGYLVLVEEADLFSAAFPNVANYLIVGNWDFTLSKKGERISLFDQNKCLSDYVVYNDKDPWPETPDGDGPTLALLDAALDNALASSWEASDVITAYFVNGSPGQPNTCIPGQSCDDGDPCTGNDIFDENCNCAGTFVLQDDDNDGVCNLIDQCPNFDNALIGTPCDDGDICTNGETYDENCGCSGGVIDDIDNDGICDPLDDCDNNLEGTPCDDGDICTAGETYDADCNCTGGIFQDADNDGICDAEDICPNLENNLLGQLCDDGDPLTEFDTYNANTCSCSGIIASAEICVNISSSEDDAEEQVDNGVVTLASGDLDMVNDEGVIFLAGMRFQNIDIPQGATITDATIQFAADEINTDPTNLTIKAEAIDHAPVFEATENNISNRTLTDASIIWQPDPWNTIGDNAIAQKTVDVSPIIQEIIDRPGFVAGNAIALIINGTGIRTAESFDGDQNLPPQLCITYSTGLCVENYPCDDNDPTTINDIYDENCDCVGENIRLNAKIMLEGFYDAQNNNMHTQLNSKNLIPLNQPYHIAPWNYDGDESVSSIPEDAVDWILLISRDSEGNVLGQAAGFVNQNGDLMHLDGTLGIPIATGEGNKFSIHHRSHLAILASNNYDGSLYDFTLGENQAAGNGQLKLIEGKYMLYAGDYDGKGIINSADFNDWKIQGAVINQYLSIDGDGNGIINSLDYNLWTNNKSKVGHPSIRY